MTLLLKTKMESEEASQALPAGSEPEPLLKTVHFQLERHLMVANLDFFEFL